MSEPFSIVLAGGGCRTFWNIGVLRELQDLLPAPREWAGVSAGSAMAVITAAGKVDEAMDAFLEATAKNPRNFYLSRVFGEEPAFPHENMYRGVLRQALSGGGFERLKTGPLVRILLAYVERGNPPFRTAIGAMRAYSRRKKTHVVHGPEQPHPGLGAEVRTAQEAAGIDEVIDHILYSSATPPVTKVPRIDGRTYIDGGFVDNVPVRALSEQARAGKVLVLLTRPVPEEHLPQSERRLYLGPEQPTPIQKWDYTSPEKIRATYEMGRADARRFMDRVQAFVG